VHRYSLHSDAIATGIRIHWLYLGASSARPRLQPSLGRSYRIRPHEAAPPNRHQPFRGSGPVQRAGEMIAEIIVVAAWPVHGT
jgi:hypothetical protein